MMIFLGGGSVHPFHQIWGRGSTSFLSILGGLHHGHPIKLFEILLTFGGGLQCFEKSFGGVQFAESIWRLNAADSVTNPLFMFMEAYLNKSN